MWSSDSSAWMGRRQLTTLEKDDLELVEAKCFLLTAWLTSMYVALTVRAVGRW